MGELDVPDLWALEDSTRRIGSSSAGECVIGHLKEAARRSAAICADVNLRTDGQRFHLFPVAACARSRNVTLKLLSMQSWHRNSKDQVANQDKPVLLHT